MALTYLEECRAALATARAEYESAKLDLDAGPCELASKQQLQEREHRAAQALYAAEQAIASELSCARYGDRHAQLTFARKPYWPAIIQCWCPDCVDGEPDPETGAMHATHEIGEGSSESEALEDYLEQCIQHTPTGANWCYGCSLPLVGMHGLGCANCRCAAPRLVPERK